jgi:hypothetical protein
VTESLEDTSTPASPTDAKAVLRRWLARVDPDIARGLPNYLSQLQQAADIEDVSMLVALRLDAQEKLATCQETDQILGQQFYIDFLQDLINTKQSVQVSEKQSMPTSITETVVVDTADKLQDQEPLTFDAESSFLQSRISESVRSTPSSTEQHSPLGVTALSPATAGNNAAGMASVHTEPCCVTDISNAPGPSSTANFHAACGPVSVQSTSTQLQTAVHMDAGALDRSAGSISPHVTRSSPAQTDASSIEPVTDYVQVESGVLADDMVDDEDDLDHDMLEEHEENARFFAELQRRDVDSVRKDLEREVEELRQQRNREQRDTLEVSNSMIEECMVSGL